MNLLLNPAPELEALIARQRRNGESVEALFLRMLQQRSRREDTARAQLRKSLAHKLAWHEAAQRREEETAERLRHELRNLAATE